ncbi:hypothetical protein ETAA8_66680 [Anatilimnocola aggregata]|uniref:Uncharacterized protein n=1 Tax=Anatilimnocola aggregata TaxID=2528021 RepID=A0A517YMQ6_9BACT|nr:hypothetical protein [Anatilimnocola aggregata]QDU31509.1 hypothetical protein ETAA8_66680 [Anatilimnocola aggregata]
MKRPIARWHRLLFIMCCLSFGLFVADVANAGHPSYWTIGRHHPSGAVQPLHPQGYAYGWFGAAPRPQAERQSGYYGLYRQWSSY